MRAAILAIVFLLSGTGSQAQEGASAASSLTELFEAANIAASRGDYASAIAKYGLLVESGVQDPDVYGNLATSFAQAGDFPRAILNYERALRLRPNDDQARDNLRQAEKSLEEQRAEAEGEAMIQRSRSLSEAVYGSFTEDGLAFALLLANLALFFGLAWAWVTARKQRWLYALLLISGSTLAFAAFGLGTKAGMFRDGPRAVTLDERLLLREGPDPRAQSRGESRGGDRGEIVSRDRDFLKFRVVGGLEGWVPASSVGLIDPDDGVH